MFIFIFIFDTHILINGHRHEAPIDRLIHSPFLWLKVTSDIDSQARIILYISPRVMPHYDVLFNYVSRQFPKLLAVFSGFKLIYSSSRLLSRPIFEIAVMSSALIFLIAGSVYYRQASIKLDHQQRQCILSIATLSRQALTPHLSTPPYLFDVIEAQHQLPGDIVDLVMSPTHFKLKGRVELAEAPSMTKALDTLFSKTVHSGDFVVISSDEDVVEWELSAEYGENL
jgi:hypothetical protein